jgi:hypothetical protein
MAFNGNFMCTTFKQGLLNGDFDFSSGTSHVFKIALYTNSAVPTNFGASSGTDMNADVKFYATNNEVGNTGSGSNPYAAGGGTLTVSQVPTTSGTTAFLSFSTETFTNATITARGAIIYRSDASAPTNDACIVLDFGADKTSTSGDFTITFPTADASSAIIRVG